MPVASLRTPPFELCTEKCATRTISSRKGKERIKNKLSSSKLGKSRVSNSNVTENRLGSTTKFYINFIIRKRFMECLRGVTGLVNVMIKVTRCRFNYLSSMYFW